jgi:hypothetical protein
VNDRQCYLGTVGWLHDDWIGALYPDDLPEDWRLAYYSTQFSCVYLPCQMWEGCTENEIVSWLADVHEGFRFVVEVEESHRDKIPIFDGRLGLALSPGREDAHLIFFDRLTDLRMLARELEQKVKSDAPLFMISRDHDLAGLIRIRELLGIMGL